MNISEKGEPRIAMSWSDVCLGVALEEFLSEVLEQ